jgi:hypothetical protein
MLAPVARAEPQEALPVIPQERLHDTRQRAVQDGRLELRIARLGIGSEISDGRLCDEVFR